MTATSTTTLAEFLLARIAEDEAVAKSATPSPWVPDDQGWTDERGRPFIQAPYHDLNITEEDAAQITRWQPSRVLAECEAKRRIVEFYGGPKGLHYSLQFLALPYADHPDYDEEWRP